MDRELAALVNEADHVMVAFDGPVCPVFTPAWRRATARRLAELLGSGLPHRIRAADDPHIVLRYAASCGAATGHVVELQLGRLELEAITLTFAPTGSGIAAPTPGALDTLAGLVRAGCTVTMFGAQSVEAIRSFLGMHGLAHIVRRISARSDANTSLPPDAFLCVQAVTALGTSPRRCLVIAGSGADIEAARAAGIPAVGYARGPDEARRLQRHQPVALIDTMADLNPLPGSTLGPALY